MVLNFVFISILEVFLLSMSINGVLVEYFLVAHHSLNVPMVTSRS